MPEALFHALDIYRAHPNRFQIIDGKLMPAINSIDGLGDNAAIYISEAAKDGPIPLKGRFQGENSCIREQP